MEQLVILVVIGLISLVNWLIQRSAEIREQRKQERESRGIPEGDPFRESNVEVPEAESPEKPPVADPAREMRKLMEALGIPLEAGETLRSEPREPAAPPKLPPPVVVTSAKPVVEKPLFPPARSTTPLEPAPRTSAFRNALHSRDSVRRAVVLREILGPPKAFTL